MSRVIVFTKAINGELKILVDAPKHPEFRERAKRLGGKFLSKEDAWVFDPRDAKQVREACLEIFGTIGGNVPLVDVTLKLHGRWPSLEMALFGRIVATVTALGLSRYGIILGEKVVIKKGDFPLVSHNEIGPVEGIILEIRDVPKNLAASEIAKHNLDASYVPAPEIDADQLNKELFG